MECLTYNIRPKNEEVFYIYISSLVYMYATAKYILNIKNTLHVNTYLDKIFFLKK